VYSEAVWQAASKLPDPQGLPNANSPAVVLQLRVVQLGWEYDTGTQLMASKRLNRFDLDSQTVGSLPAHAFGALWWWWTIHGTQLYRTGK